MQPTSLAVTPAAGAASPLAPAVPALTLAADTRSVSQHAAQALKRGVNMEDDKGQSPAVAVVGIVGGISLAVVAIFAIFVRNQMPVAGWIVTVLALMGVIVAPLAGRRK